MALNKAQTLTLLQAMVDVRQNLRAYLAGDFSTDINALSTAIAAGDDEPETVRQRDAMQAMIAAAEGFWDSTAEGLRAVALSLGRYAGSPNLSDPETCLAYFNQKLVDDSEAIVSRGLTKFSSLSAGGSNVGDGGAVVHDSDPSGTAPDVSHIETLTFECVKSSFEGAPIGKEQFVIRGQDLGGYAWEERGSAAVGVHQWTLGLTDEDHASEQPRAGHGETLLAKGWARSAGNIVRNGDFAAAEGTSTTKIANHTITSNPSNVARNTTTYLLAASGGSLAFSGNAVLDHDLDRIDTRCSYTLAAWTRVDAAVTAGTITIKVKDDSTTHATITVDTTGLTNDTWTKATEVKFMLPQNVGANLRVEIEMASYAGSGNAYVGAYGLFKNTLVDGRGICIIQGQTPWRRGDVFTGATTVSETGKISRELGGVFRRSVKHAGSATYWSDPT